MYVHTPLSCYLMYLSPGRIPIILNFADGEIALAKSVILIDGILGTNISPPNILSKFLRTKNSIAQVIQNLVILKSVIGK